VTTQHVQPVGDPPDGRTYLTYTTDDDGVHVRCREPQCVAWDCLLPDNDGGAPTWMAFAVALQHVREAHGGEGTV